MLAALAVLMSLALLGWGVWAFFDDADLGVLDQRASVISMFIGGLGLAATLWAQRRPQAGQVDALATTTGQASSSGSSSPTVAAMTDGMVIGHVSSAAQLSGPHHSSAKAERSIAVGGDVEAPVLSGDGVITFTGRSRGRPLSVTGDISHLVFAGDVQPPRRSLPDALHVPEPQGLTGLPRRPAAAFVGRDQALKDLRATLTAGAGAEVISQAVVGLGGVGKSELALQYAHRHRDDYRLVWWIDADTPDQIQSGLASLAQAIVAGADSAAAEQATTAEAAAWALAWMSSHQGWLIVFDNVEEVNHIETYLARLIAGHVLITTRRDIGWQHLGITPLRLELLERQASLALLAELLGPQAKGQAELLDQLAEQLGDLPLALTQAGAYITRTPRMSVTRYLRLLKDAPARMHAAAPAGDSVRVVATVWAVSCERIAAVDPLAVHLLQLLACYAPDNLPATVLDELDAEDDLAVGEALALLASYSLVTVTTSNDDPDAEDPQDLVSMHRLLQAAILAQLPDDQHDALQHRAADLLQAALPDNADHVGTWPAFRRLLPHARAVVPLDSPYLQQILDYLRQSGDHATGLAIQRDVYTHHLHRSGSNHPETLTARHNLADWTGEAGDAAAARDQLAALLPDRERALGTDHPSTLLTRQNLANWTGEAGDAAAARDQLATLLPIEEQARSAEHPDTLLTRHNLAHWTGQAGDAAAARDQLAALLPDRERVLGADHPSTLLTRYDLARWMGEAGDAAAARDQLAALLPDRERALGTDHPSTLLTRQNLANWTGEAGDAAAARDQLATLLPIEEQVRGAEHLETLLTRQNLAHWMGEAGDAAAARDQLAALLPIFERVQGAEHPITLTARHNLAQWTGQAGDAATARDQLTALLPDHERILGAEHPDTLTTRYNLAHWTGEAGDAAAARDQLTALLPIEEQVRGAEHPDTLTTRYNLVRLAGSVGDAAGARDQLAALLPIEEQVRGAEHPDTLTTRQNLANLTGQAGDAAAARDQLTALLSDYERILGAEHPNTLTIRYHLARWIGEAGDAAAARDQLTALLSDYERILGAEHPDTLATRQNLTNWTGEAGHAAAARDQLTALLSDYERILGADHPDTLATRHYLTYWTELAAKDA
ncbi:tetratricopeptide repeat protein [Nonomuraea sp. NPDC049758]|uniref:tetratricopeptide repeat protein n=1 Tax=Nonomuraea sp. NPDC049758 TaxID=3154360 RepID=UPI00342D683C